VRFPLDSIDRNAAEIHIVGELSPEGKFNGRYWEKATGTRQYALRGPFSSPIDSVHRAEASRAIATGFFRGASGDSLVGFDGKDLQAEPKVSMVIRNGSASKRSGDTDILSIPIASLSGWAENMVNNLESRGERRFPIDAAAVIGPATTFSEYRVTLPEGWKARVPQNVTVNGPFGLYESKYSQTGRELVVSRRMRGTTGVLPKERISDLIGWLSQVATDDVRFIVIEHTSTPTTGTK